MHKNHWLRLLACVFVVVFAGSCAYFDPGPDLIVEVFSPQGQAPVAISDPLTVCGDPANPQNALTLQATTGNPAFCCCRVVGRLVNRSTVSIHALLKFKACDDNELLPIGTAIDFIQRVVPGEDRPFSATGLVRPCNDVDRVELVEVDLNGVVFP